MKIAAITFRLHAPWVHSLKEKRMIVKSIIGKLQSRFHVSAAEIDEQDTHQIIVVGVAAIVPHNAQADSLMDKISQFVEENCEAEIFMEAQKQLTLEGNIVISVGLFGHSGDSEVWTEGTKEMLDDMHKRKIDMADEIFVINVGGYIGSSTRSEIEYANRTGKVVQYLEPVEK